MSSKALPPPLPPETRTVGQVVAGGDPALRRPLPARAPARAAARRRRTLAVGTTVAERILILVVAAPAFTLAFAWASALAGDVRPGRGTWLRALVLGSLVFLPAAVFFPWFAILSVAWLALVGLVVPVVMIEDAPLRAALRRAVELCRADYVHALGSLATLVIVFVLTRSRSPSCSASRPTTRFASRSSSPTSSSRRSSSSARRCSTSTRRPE